MATSRVIVLGVAVAAAIGAGLVARNMLTPPPPVVVEASAPMPSIRMTDVLVVKSDVPMGATIGSQIGWQSWPSSGVYDHFITRDRDPEAATRYASSIARMPMYAGEPLRSSKLIGDGQSFMSAILPPGKRAIATQISASTSAGGFILPNDRVDVIMTRRSQSANGSSGFVTETILRNIRVLAIDQTIQEDEEGRRVKVGETATLSLRSVADAQEVPDFEADYLVSGTGRRGTIRLIRSGEISEMGAR